ncbi:hypothetical protein PPL_02055 [Heterostelium album PN500]|uniref:Uncharacterized protein n=1 Tax=Heterostelium pallidum (strain ATCC 26659 / Pp 5 / PN500) TaxID=670386 RepID=D3B185_HETP5|nr:hypothetical protein PPL_02055 [Heterostelium album PN500]EFA85059.1 hypothetical protein PPL_02055 [Heterostelium album PN500]|eukprot:XP_020437169.1 hypothetical protein PPL_02055 [Heterostelium album PN500]
MNHLLLYYLPTSEQIRNQCLNNNNKNDIIVDYNKYKSREELHQSLESILFKYTLGYNIIDDNTSKNNDNDNNNNYNNNHISKNNINSKIKTELHLVNQLKLLLYNTINSLNDRISTETKQSKIKKLFWRHFRLILINNNNNNNNNNSDNRYSKDIVQQILYYLCESQALHVVTLILNEIYRGDTDRLIQWFLSDDRYIQVWFQHFHYDGRSKYGAVALERFLFANRDDVWHRIVWLKQPIPPPVLAQKREMMLQINVLDTIKSLLQSDDQFTRLFINDYLFDSIYPTGSNAFDCCSYFLSMNNQYFIDQLYQLLMEKNNDNYILDRFDRLLSNLFKSTAANNNNNNNNNDNNDIPFLVLRLLDEDDLLQFTYDLLDEQYVESLITTKFKSTTTTTTSYNETELIVNCILVSRCRWNRLESLLLYNAISPQNINKIIKPLFKDNDQSLLTDEQIEFKKNIISLLVEYYGGKLKSKDDLEKEIVIPYCSHSHHILQKNSVISSIKFLLLDTFIYYFILESIKQQQHQQQQFNINIESLLKDNNIEYQQQCKEDKTTTTTTLSENELLLSLSSSDSEDNSKKKRKKKKKSKEKRKKQRSLFKDDDNDDDDNDDYGFGHSNHLDGQRNILDRNWIIPMISKQVTFTTHDLIQILYQFKFDEIFYKLFHQQQ